MRKIYVSAIHESSGKTNLRFHSFEGTDITDSSVDINKMRQKIGMVFQQFNLFPNHTVKGNIMLAPVQTGLMTKEEAETCR